MTKRRPSAEESELFRRTIGPVKPVAGKRRGPERPKHPSPKVETPPAKPVPRPVAVPPPAARPRPAPALGRFADLDKRTAERFRRGELPIEGRLDLHGLTQAEAHRRLESFVGRAVAAGRRMLIVITGKGEGTAGAGGAAGRGVLREATPRWLAEPALRPHVLAIAHAQPRHGGSGALYVLLRKQREERR
jgi:DNA-nicking Smr family endonuclease